MNTEELLALHEDTSAKCRDIMRRKNNDYTGGQGTDDPFANFNMSSAFGVHPALGVVLRIGDKLQRIRSFANDGALQVSGETIDDACEDIVNYAIIIKGIFRAQAAQHTEAAAEEDYEPDHYGHHNGAATVLQEGYRLLEEGETIEAGDEYERPPGKWHEVRFIVGQTWRDTDHYPVRRPLAAEQQPAYRMLEDGEVIQEGDEFQVRRTGAWEKTHDPGWPVEAARGINYRRPV